MPSKKQPFARLDSDNQKNVIVKKIIKLIDLFSSQQASGTDIETQWLIENCEDDHLKDIIAQSTISMLHILDAIYLYGPTNGIAISKKSRIPKGTVSKIARKLVNFKLIEITSLPDNRKERHFNTTNLGEELAELHQKLHSEIEPDFLEFLSQYSDDELDLLTRMLNDFTKYYFEGYSVKPLNNMHK